MTQTVLENEFDNEYGTMSMGMGPGRSFPDFEDYEQVLLKCISHCLKITQNVSFEFWHLSPIFVHILQVFKTVQNLSLWTFLMRLSCDFQTPCMFSSLILKSDHNLLL